MIQSNIFRDSSDLPKYSNRTSCATLLSNRNASYVIIFPLAYNCSLSLNFLFIKMRERERKISTRYLLCENNGPRFFLRSSPYPSPISAFAFARASFKELVKLSTLLAVAAPRRPLMSATADRRECTACACKPPRIKAVPDRLCYYERS